MISDEKIRNRRKNDNERLDNAYSSFEETFKSRKEKGTFKSEDPKLDRPIALYNICRYLRIDAPSFDPYSSNSEKYMLDVLRENGVMQRPCELLKGWYRNAVGAYMGELENGRVVAVLPDKLGVYYYHNPETGNRVIVTKNNEDGIKRAAFIYYRPLPQKKLNSYGLFQFMMETVDLKDIMLAIFTALFVALIGLIIPLANSLMLEQIIITKNAKMVFSLSSFLVNAIIARYIISILQSLTQNRISQRMTLSVQSAMFARTLDLPASFFRNHHTGDVYGALSYIEPLCTIWSNIWFSSGIALVFSGLYIFQMKAAVPGMQFPALCILILELIIQINGIYGLRKNVSDRLNSTVATNSLALDILSGIEQIKVFGAQKRSLARYAEVYKHQADAEYRPPIHVKLQNALLPAVNIFGMGILFYFADALNLNGREFVYFYTAYGLANAAVMGIAGLGSQIASIEPIMRMLAPILETEPEIISGGRDIGTLKGNVELENIEFRYSHDAPPVLNNLNFSVKAGEYVAIVGGSGSGKTTLTRLLLGFEKPQTGAVYYDGDNLNNLDLACVRQQIGVVLQNGKLFTGNLFTNIAISTPGLTEEEAWDAAEKAGIAEDIREMPLGMFTIVSDGNGALSGGQKQRLLIARAIAQKPSMLILDEATSALDNVTQKKVTDALSDLNCTRIVIAHRLSTIKDCDRIVVLEKGQIVEEGNYEELMQKNGEFAKLVKYQLLETA
ncbi:ATP-binding cassette domain-containing protein [Butyrivibrio sp. VCD2006]|uniref:ATP-binding cassette domain-containing protein n=1 Tax=Butyrivibrio sp. VCD2006 TaxID=1280664 RepID=UPI000403541B|nr:ATP-binding cassette domain-containing protein [Butyrivibrio sp. VCD2006]